MFHAIADRNRPRIIDLLAAGEKSVQEPTDSFDITIAAVYLTVLRQCGLVIRRAQGRRRFYGLDAAPLQIVDHWTARHRRFWRSRLRRLRGYLDKSR